jgi:hypothetical protein
MVLPFRATAPAHAGAMELRRTDTKKALVLKEVFMKGRATFGRRVRRTA